MTAEGPHRHSTHQSIINSMHHHKQCLLFPDPDPAVLITYLVAMDSPLCSKRVCLLCVCRATPSVDRDRDRATQPQPAPRVGFGSPAAGARVISASGICTHPPTVHCMHCMPLISYSDCSPRPLSVWQDSLWVGRGL